MEFVDRVSAYPNRYAMTDEDGNVSYVILERADEPTVPGTPLNAETFNAILADVEKVKAILGVDLGVTATEKHTTIEVADFDYFLVYANNYSRPIRCQVESQQGGGTVLAICIERIINVNVGEYSPGFRLYFTWENGAYTAEFQAISQQYGILQSGVAFNKIVGYKYPPVKE